MSWKISPGAASLALAKGSLRQSMRQVRDQIPRDEALKAARQACARLVSLALARQAQVVGLYVAVHGELTPAPAREALRSHGIALVYPRVVPGRRALAFCRVDDPTGLVPGSYGIPEPPAHVESVPLEIVDLVVVPGLAFDHEGHRLGWGKGHYDATLAGCRALRVGFAHACQIVAAVPRTERDLAMDVLVTNSSVMHVAARTPGQRSDV